MTIIKKNIALPPLSSIKQLIEPALAAELDSHFTQDIAANRKNGSTKNS